MLGVFPILYTFYLSLTRYSGLKEAVFIGTQNYERMLGDPMFWKAIYNTLYYTLLAVPIGVVVAMVLALAMNQRVREIADLPGDVLHPFDPARLRHLVHLHHHAQPGLRARELPPYPPSVFRHRTGSAIRPTARSPSS